MNRSEFLKAVTVKHETIKLESIEMEVTIKEPTITESQKIESVRQKVLSGAATNQDLIIEACRYAMVEPEFFTDDELANISATGMGILTEIYMRLPEIGMSEKQKEDYRSRLIESFNNGLSKILSDEELAKKPSKKKGLDLN